MPEITKKEAEEEIKKKAKNVKEEDIKKVLEKQDEIEKKFSGKGPLGRFVSDVKLLFSMIQDYVKGEYREVPYWTISIAVATFLYVINPVDIIPDIAPGVGYIDDALAISVCLAMIDRDLQKYKEWKKI